jgi:uncharacterized SAM-binding protein YcdF (DUF218 family)
MRTALRAMRVLAGTLVLLAVLWAGGFAWFVHQSSIPPLPPPHADGIVVLTGGAGRVEAALRLLQEGRAPLLLISGAGALSGLDEIVHRAGIADASPFAGKVTIGHAATSTFGNAAETAAWVQAHDIGTLIVVTSGYHMPRALTELSRAMPAVRLIPYPVVLPAMRHASPAMLKLLAGEYTKWLGAEAGLSRFGYLREDIHLP